MRLHAAGLGQHALPKQVEKVALVKSFSIYRNAF
jgi:hypothetical protein